jgi:hypothetical protein
MAGQDQSVDLSGMLNQIAGTIGEGYQIDEKNAGAAMGGIIANAVKPELDMNDPASVRKYAEWAGRNGKKEEATLMHQKAAELEGKQRAMQGAITSQEASLAGNQAIQDGNQSGLQQQIKTLQEQMQTAQAANDVDGFKAAQASLVALTNPQAQERMHNAETLNKVSAVTAMNKMLADPESGATPEANALMRDKVNSLMEDAEVATIAGDQAIQQAKLVEIEKNKETTAEVEGYVASVSDPNLTVEEIEEQFNKLSPAAQAASIAVKNEFIRSYDNRVERNAKAQAQGTKVMSEDYVVTLKEGVANLPEKQREAAEQLIDNAAKADNARFVGGTYNGFGGRDAAEAASTKLSGQLNALTMNHAKTLDDEARATVIEDKERLRKAELGTIHPPQSQIDGIMQHQRLLEQPVDAATAREMAINQNKVAYRDLQREQDPEAFQQHTEAVQAGMNPDWSAEQMEVAMSIVTDKKLGDKIKSKMKMIDKIQDPAERAKKKQEVWNQLRSAAEANGLWPESEEEAAAANTDTAPANAINEDGYVTGQSGGQNAQQFIETLNYSTMHLINGLGRTAGSVLNSEALRSVPMNTNPEVYGNYRQQ